MQINFRHTLVEQMVEKYLRQQAERLEKEAFGLLYMGYEIDELQIVYRDQQEPHIEVICENK